MTAQQISDFIIQNWFGFLTAIVLSIYFYVKAKRDKEPYFVMRTTKFISGISAKLPGLKVSYQGDGQDHAIENVSITRLTFWNNGRQTIDKKDVAVPIEIDVGNHGRILDYAIVDTTDEANEFKAQRNREKTCITLTFNYIDFREACVLQFVHTVAHESSLKLVGKIKGAKIREGYLNPQAFSRIQAFSNMCAYALLAFGAGCYGTYAYGKGENWNAFFAVCGAVGFAVMSTLMFIGLCSFMIIPLGNKEPESHIPN